MAIAVKTGQNSQNNTSVYVATSSVIAEVTLGGNETVTILRQNTSQLSALKIFNANRLNNGKLMASSSKYECIHSTDEDKIMRRKF